MWMTIVSLLIGLIVSISASGFPEFNQWVLLPVGVYPILFAISLFSPLLPLLWISLTSVGSRHKTVDLAALQSVIEDRRLYVCSGLAFLLSLLGLFFVSSPLLLVPYRFAIATVLFGGLMDLLCSTFLRIQYRRTSEGVCEWLLDRMHRALDRKNEKLLMDSFEMVFPLVVESMESGNVLSVRAFSQKASALSEMLLRVVGKLPLFSIRGESEATMLDRFMFAEAMTAKRLAWLVTAARESGNPAAVEEAVRLYGKLFLVFHSHHSSLGHLLLVSLCQQTQNAEERDLHVEVVVALSEVIKSLIDRSIELGGSEKDSILRTIKLLETYVKESFRRDKTMSIVLLMQPFAEIGQLLGGARYESLIDREEILGELRRILAQFAALETVTGRFEAGAERTDTAATFSQDIPFRLPEERST